jgi:hypothetical protein
VEIDSLITIRPMLKRWRPIDHRALDGLAARFLAWVPAWLEGMDERLTLG